jgi:hypothetical protein
MCPADGHGAGEKIGAELQNTSQTIVMVRIYHYFCTRFLLIPCAIKAHENVLRQGGRDAFLCIKMRMAARPSA